MNKHKGFTLIELMITVAIIGILSAIAIPSYQQYILKSRRAVAKSFLLDVSAKQQQYLLDARTYAVTLSALNVSLPTEIQNYYTASFTTTPTATTFSIQVVPKNGQEKDLSGATIKIDNMGTKSPDSAWK